jgi:hypothetical protein
MQRWIGAAFLAMLPQLAAAESPPCEQAAFAAVVGEASAALTALNDESKKAFQAKLVALKSREGWAEADYAAKATPYVKDATIAALDESNKGLLARVPTLGAESEAAGGPDAARRCAMLGELRALMTRVVENTRAKWAHMFGKMDAALEGTREAKAPAP